MLIALIMACSSTEPGDASADPPVPEAPAPEPEPEPEPAPEPEPEEPVVFDGEPFPPAFQAEVGERAPDFALESATGVFHLEDHEGDVILLELAGFF